jgi:hypothetical protein
MTQINSKSSFISLLSKGKFFDILAPWNIYIDFSNNTIEVQKRNWYLIGTDKNIVSFKYIRNITIDEHLFGGSIKIKVTGGNLSAECLPKDDCHSIKKALIEYNNSSKKHIIMH